MTQYQGINNVDQPEKLAANELRRAVNVDIDKRGNIRRRLGYQLINSGAAHSLFCYGDLCVFARGATLYRLLADNTEQALFTELTQDQPLAYCEVNGEVYWTSLQDRGVIRDGVNHPWGVSAPAPTILSTGLGSLRAGRYQVLLTWIQLDGRESGAGPSALISLSSSGGVVISGVTPPTLLDVVAYRVYLTPPDGEVFYFAVEVPRDIGTVTVADCQFAEPVQNQFLQPPPYGSHLAYYHGRLLVADGKTLWYSEPLAYDWFRMAENFYLFKTPIRLLGSVSGGVFVVTDETHFLAGDDLHKAAMRTPSEDSGVPGTMIEIEADRLPQPGTGRGLLWVTREGVVAGLAGGQYVKLTASRVAVDEAPLGTALYRENDGLRQYLALLAQDGEANGLAARDSVEAEVYRHGHRVV